MADEPSRRGSDSLASLLRVMALWTGVLMLVSLIDTVVIGEGAENWCTASRCCGPPSP